ncbi:uncharacterized protein BO80DRAFT_426543 [Aspergillus ibericus CBS 121593]|uniref:Alpha-ketoglutarate-dependent dioxygenase AlkB-like domain-containing protein n=1 Tax=Aspergillus ibericus CBS 121593 TaxID=1448316 RepID=A0A395GW04_9EURO|nr:hypothetical protein BO80DRAFT_426543 [Aspergillus ibericus CBS 121593]RAK99559.1 hypothetical protein BO80DRAFT_426543 [Aspergillus ibericus CBS 121593]
MKRINTFFPPLPSKKPKPDPSSATYTHHPSYPLPIRNLPSTIATPLSQLPSTPSKAITITNHPHLDLLYYQPFLPAPLARDLFHFLRAELPFYRVQYTIHRNGTPTNITTPRYTTVFGVDDTSIFIPDPTTTASDDSSVQSQILVDSKTRIPVPDTKYHNNNSTNKEKQKGKGKGKIYPRPIPPCLNHLRQAIEALTTTTTTPPNNNNDTAYNFILVNYYATTEDSIAYHSDDERFLGPNPTIASLSLGARRDFRSWYW